MISPSFFLAVGAVLFGIGAAGLLIRRNPLVMFMCIELMLNAVNLSFVALARELGDIGGQTTVLFGRRVLRARGGGGRGRRRSRHHRGHHAAPAGGRRRRPVVDEGVTRK